MHVLKLFNTETIINYAESALVKSLVQENSSPHFMKYLTVHEIPYGDDTLDIYASQRSV